MARAQTVEWTHKIPVDSPAPRYGAAMASDSARGDSILFGGYVSNSFFSNATWEWDGNDWTQLLPADSPSLRAAHVMAYDSKRGRIVLFGGYDGSNNLGDTWEWDGTDWTQITPKTSPPARSNGAMSYDSKRGRVVLFGGSSDDSGTLNDTWEWDGANWTQITPRTSPPARSDAVMAYDSGRGRSVLFGGYDGDDDLGDTWEWDGTNWKESTPSTSPLNRSNATMIYDATRARSILFGGANVDLLLNDTWEWDGTNWAQLAPSTNPPARSYAAMAYDSVEKHSILFGGYSDVATNHTHSLSDTWELYADAPPPHLTLVGGSVKEGNVGSNNTLTSTARLDHAVDYPITLEVSPVDGTATEDEDYTTSSDPFYVTIAAGKTSAALSVKVIGDEEVEDNETVVLRVDSVDGDVIADDNYVTGTIVDDDSTAPVNVSISPTTTTSPGGQAKTFTSTQTDPNGGADIQQSMLLISANGNAKGGILARYDGTTGLLYLRDESDKNWIGGFPAGSANLISTRYGALDCKGTKVTLKGQSLIIKWVITPRLIVTAGQTRTLKLSLSASDATDTVDTVVTNDLASWTISSPTLQNVAAFMTAPSSPVGKSNTLNIEVRNSASVGQERINFIVSPSGSNAAAIAGVIDVATKTVALYDDAGRKLSAPVVFGTRGAVLSNSQGTLNVGASKFKLGTQTVIVSLSLQPSVAFGTGIKGLYLKSSTATDVTPRDLLGNWNITAKATKGLEAPELEDKAPSAPSS